MSEPVFSLARIIAPRAKDPNGPEALGEKLAGLLGRAQTYLEDHIIPNPPETYTQPWTQLCFIHVRKLRRHIRRLEHGLRCFILFLATRLLASSDGRARAEDWLARPPRSAARIRKDDPDYALDEPKPKRSSFQAVFGPSNGGKGRVTCRLERDRRQSRHRAPHRARQSRSECRRPCPAPCGPDAEE